MKKTTIKDFNKFKKECSYWQKELNLLCYELEYKHETLEDKNAEITYNTEIFYAIITLNTEIHNITIDELALHEMIHLLLGEFHIYARSRFTTNDQLEVCNEKITKVLTRVLKKED